MVQIRSREISFKVRIETKRQRFLRKRNRENVSVIRSAYKQLWVYSGYISIKLAESSLKINTVLVNGWLGRRSSVTEFSCHGNGYFSFCLALFRPAPAPTPSPNPTLILVMSIRSTRKTLQFCRFYYFSSQRID